MSCLNVINPLLITEFSLDLGNVFADSNCPYASYSYDFTSMTNLRKLSLDSVMLDFLQFSTQNLISLTLFNLVKNGTYGRYAGNTYLTQAITEFLANMPLLQEFYTDNFPHLPNFVAISPCLRIVHMFAFNYDLHTIREFMDLHSNSLVSIRISMNNTAIMNLFDSFALFSMKFPNLTHLSFSFDDFTFTKYEHRTTLFLPIAIFPKLFRLTFSFRKQVTNFDLLASLTRHPNINVVTLRPDTHKIPDYEDDIFVLDADFLNRISYLDTVHRRYYYINVDVSKAIDERSAIRKLLVNPFKRNDYWSN